MQNQDVMNALLNDPEVVKLLTKLSKNETVNAVLSNNNAYSGPYYPQNHNNNCQTCQCHNRCDNRCDNNFGLGGLGLLFLVPLLFCGFGGGCGFGGFGRGFGGFGCGCGGWDNCFSDCCDCCCCDFWC